MKLLFDQNLSPKLVDRLLHHFPGSSHVQSVGLDCANDEDVWVFARQNDFVIVTKDADFNSLSVLQGSPPRVIWLQIGNCTTTHVENAFLAHLDEIEAFEDDPDIATLVVS